MIKKINQKHKLGCASACLAMVTDLSYEQALKKLKPHRKSGQRTSVSTIELVKILRKIGFNPIVYYYLSDKKISELNSDALIIVKTDSENNYNHVIVWNAKHKRILDPGRSKALSLKTYQKGVRFIIELG